MIGRVCLMLSLAAMIAAGNSAFGQGSSCGACFQTKDWSCKDSAGMDWPGDEDTDCGACSVDQYGTATCPTMGEIKIDPFEIEAFWDTKRKVANGYDPTKPAIRKGLSAGIQNQCALQWWCGAGQPSCEYRLSEMRCKNLPTWFEFYIFHPCTINGVIQECPVAGGGGGGEG